jgi:hypothetical protein
MALFPLSTRSLSIALLCTAAPCMRTAFISLHGPQPFIRHQTAYSPRGRLRCADSLRIDKLLGQAECGTLSRKEVTKLVKI